MDRRTEPSGEGPERQSGRFTRNGETDLAGEGTTRTRVQPETQVEPGRGDEQHLESERTARRQPGPREDHEQREHDVTHRGSVAPPAGRTGVGHETMRDIRARQRDEFGGFSLGATFFGWLVAFGIAALLTGLLSAAGAATGLTEGADQETLGLAGGITLLIATAIAYYCGGYVAGRLSRFDGGRQGFGVWILGLLITVALGALAYVAGSEYNVIDRAGLPRLTVGEETATTAGIIAMAVMLAVTLLAAVLGGKAGEKFHTKIDRHAVDSH